MFFRFPCPKCREKMRLRAAKCSHCGYRPMKHEARHAHRLAELKLLVTCPLVGMLFYVAQHR